MKEKKIDPEKLAVLMVGTEYFMGEVEDMKLGEPTLILNPKRLARFQTVRGDQVAVSFMVGDLDLVEGGVLVVIPHGGYYLGWLDDKSVEAMLNLYMEFITRKQVNSARAAGLTLPGQR